MPRSPKSILGTRSSRIQKTTENPFRTTDRQRENSIQRGISNNRTRHSSTWEMDVLGMRRWRYPTQRGPRRQSKKNIRCKKAQSKRRRKMGRGTHTKSKRRRIKNKIRCKKSKSKRRSKMGRGRRTTHRR